MTTRFLASINGVDFEFISMDVSKPRLFQVYVTHNGQKLRFHIQANKEGEFLIPLKNEVCPEPYREFEKQLGEAIVNQYK